MTAATYEALRQAELARRAVIAADAAKAARERARIDQATRDYYAAKAARANR